MPRRDGFPTNPEMLADFNTAARDVFVAAFERQIESKVSPAYEDKPLGLIYLNFWRHGSEAALADGTTAVLNESSQIQTLSTDDTESIGDIIGWREHSEEALQFYHDTAERLGKIVITNNLRLSPLLPPTGIRADYCAYMKNGRTRHIDTFKEKPAKQSIAAGTYFMEEAAAYVQSDTFDKPKAVRWMDYLIGLGNTEPTEQLQHKFGFFMTPGLPLNGRESIRFLQRYLELMAKRREHGLRRIERLENMGAVDRIVAFEKDGLHAVDAALRRVTAILENRN